MYKDLDRFEPKKSPSAMRPRGPDPIASLREENEALKAELSELKSAKPKPKPKSKKKKTTKKDTE